MQRKPETLDSQWKEWQNSLTEVERVQLDIIDADGPSLVRLLLKYINAMREQHAAETVTVILPEVATRSSLRRSLHTHKSFASSWLSSSARRSS